MALPFLPSAKQPTTGACSLISSFLQIGTTSLHSPLSPKQATSGEHRMEELQKGCAVALMVLTFNCGLAAYLLWGDAECVASVGVTYVVVVLLLARRFGCWEPGTHGRRRFRCLDALICFLSLSVAALLASRVARTAAPSSASALLVAAAGATVRSRSRRLLRV